MLPFSMAFLLLVTTILIGCSQSSDSNALFEQLTKGSNPDQALETILKNSQEHAADLLFTGAGVAFKEKRLEDAAFLLYAGQLRMRFDQKCFAAKGTGGSSPFIALAALSQTMGSVINPAIMSEPKSFARVMERIGKWSPRAPEGYKPGFEYTARLTEEEARQAAEPNRAEFVSRMSDLATLLNDAEYFAASRVIQAYNMPGGDNRPSKDENDKATETMKRIESERKLKGFFTK